MEEFRLLLVFFGFNLFDELNEFHQSLLIMLVIILHFVELFHLSDKFLVVEEDLDRTSQLALRIWESFSGLVGLEHLSEFCSSTNWMPRIVMEHLIFFVENGSRKSIGSDNEDSLLVAVVELLVKAISHQSPLSFEEKFSHG